MNKVLSTLYAIFVCAIIITLLYLVAPYVVKHPKTATIVLAVALLSSLGAGLRSMIEIGIMRPMIKIANGKTKSLVFCPIVFVAGLLASIAIPWLNGISAWNVWNWIASIGFTLFNFETFYAFIGATLRVYNMNT